MGPNESWLVFVSLYVSLLVLMGPYGFLWVLMRFNGPHATLWVLMFPYWSLWVFMGLFGS